MVQVTQGVWIEEAVQTEYAEIMRGESVPHTDAICPHATPASSPGTAVRDLKDLSKP